jgi:hypothetical protein
LPFHIVLATLDEGEQSFKQKRRTNKRKEKEKKKARKGKRQSKTLETSKGRPPDRLAEALYTYLN